MRSLLSLAVLRLGLAAARKLPHGARSQLQRRICRAATSRRVSRRQKRTVREQPKINGSSKSTVVVKTKKVRQNLRSQLAQLPKHQKELHGHPTPLSAACSPDSITQVVRVISQILVSAADSGVASPNQIAQVLVNEYANMAFSRQMQMLGKTLVEEGLITKSEDALTCPPLEPTLSWRSLRNPFGIKAFAFDVFLYREAHTPVRSAKVKAKRGFGAAATSGTRDLQPLDDVDATYHWLVVRSVAEELRTRNGKKPRILIPRTFSKRFDSQEMSRINLEYDDCDLTTYWGDAPFPESVISYEHSLVLVVVEAQINPTEKSWTLNFEDDDDLPATEDVAGTGAAPVIVLSVMEHSVELKLDLLIKDIKFQLKELLQDIDEPQPRGESNFLDTMLDILSGQEKQMSVNVEALNTWIGDSVGPFFETAYNVRWQRLRDERLTGLVKAKALFEAAFEKEKEKAAQAEAARAEVMEAIACLDRRQFEESAGKALRKKAISDDEVSMLQEELEEGLAAAEAPFRTLMATFSGDFHELLRKLESVQATTILPRSSSWHQIANYLSKACRAALELGQASAHTWSSSRMAPSDIDRLEASVAKCQKAAQDFEVSTKLANVSERSSCAASLWREVALGNDLLAMLRRDEVLKKALAEPPWNADPWNFTLLGDSQLEELRQVSSQASQEARDLLKQPLQRALDAARRATDLRKAMEAKDISALSSLLQSSAAEGWQGLEGPRELLLDLREKEVETMNMRQEVEEAVSKLDAGAFEQLIRDAKELDLQISDEEERNLRTKLFSKTMEAESSLRAVVQSEDATAEMLFKAYTTTALPSTNAWYQLAEVRCAAIKTTDEIGSKIANPSSVTSLEQSIRDGTAAVQRLKDAMGATGFPSAALSTAAALQEHIKEGEEAMHQKKADAALLELLSSDPWFQRPVSWQEVEDRDVAELEAKAAHATSECREHVAQALKESMKKGSCALNLREALQSDDPQALADCIEEAKSIGLGGLEIPEQKLQELQKKQKQVSDQVQKLQAFQRTQKQVSGAVQKNKVTKQDWHEGASNIRWNSKGNVHEQEEGCTNLIFLDLELTSGFYDFDQRPFILEAALVVTDKDLHEKDSGHWVLGGFTRQQLEALGEFHQIHFRDSRPGGQFPPVLNSDRGNGLFADVLSSRLTLYEAETQMLEMVKRHCPEGACPLVGYSVQCDREILKMEMPRLYQHLSHQILDISGFFRMVRLWLPDGLPDQVPDQGKTRTKLYNHRAPNDVDHAIETLRRVRKNFFNKLQAGDTLRPKVGI